MAEELSQVTRLLAEWRHGDSKALNELIPLVHHELRLLAGHYLGKERKDHSFDPTDLVHEAYLRLVDKTHPQWRNRAHFYAVAGQLMRHILVDHARRVRSHKRGGGVIKLSLDEADAPAEQQAADVVALHEALEALSVFDARKAKIIELRFFGGLSIPETAEYLKVSTATVIKGARLARAWLYKEMQRQSMEPEP